MTETTRSDDRDDDLARRRVLNRRIGWLLALTALAIFVATLLARS